MENDKFQGLVLEKLEMLTVSVDTLALNQELLQEEVLNLKQDVTTLKKDVTNIRQSQARIEHNLSEKVTALFDFRENQIETNRQFSARLDRIEAK